MFYVVVYLVNLLTAGDTTYIAGVPSSYLEHMKHYRHVSSRFMAESTAEFLNKKYSEEWNGANGSITFPLGGKFRAEVHEKAFEPYIRPTTMSDYL